MAPRAAIPHSNNHAATSNLGAEAGKRNGVVVTGSGIEVLCRAVWGQRVGLSTGDLRRQVQWSVVSGQWSVVSGQWSRLYDRII